MTKKEMARRSGSFTQNPNTLLSRATWVNVTVLDTGDSKTTTQPLSETVQQGAETAKKSAQSGMETTKDAAAKASEAALGAPGSGKPIVLSLVDGDNWLTGSAFVVLMM